MLNLLENGDDERYYATAMFVSFTSYQERIACGELQTQYMDRVFSFAGLDQLLLIMDDVMDFVRASCEKITFPQAEFERRNFKKSKSQAFHVMDETEHVAEFCVRPAEIMAGGMVYAAITVYYRMHASIQGELRIAKQKMFFSQRFRTYAALASGACRIPKEINLRDRTEKNI